MEKYKLSNIIDINLDEQLNFQGIEYYQNNYYLLFVDFSSNNHNIYVLVIDSNNNQKIHSFNLEEYDTTDHRYLTKYLTFYIHLTNGLIIKNKCNQLYYSVIINTNDFDEIINKIEINNNFLKSFHYVIETNQAIYDIDLDHSTGNIINKWTNKVLVSFSEQLKVLFL